MLLDARTPAGLEAALQADAEPAAHTLAAWMHHPAGAAE